MKTRQYSIVICFFLTTLGLSIFSLVNDFGTDTAHQGNPSAPPKEGAGEVGDESYFKVVNYYILDKKKRFMNLEATELTLSRQNTVAVAFDPHGIFYRYNDKGEEEPLYFTAKNSRTEMPTKELLLQDDVDLTTETSNLKADKVTILRNGKQVEATGSVRTKSVDLKTGDQVLINSDFALYRPSEKFFEYQKNVKGQVQKKRKYEENVSFTSDLLTFMGLQSLIEMKGNVTFKKGNLDASSNQGSVFLENYNKRLKYYSLSDDVRLQESLIVEGKKVMRKAFSEKLEGIISEKKVVLTGLPKVFQGKDVTKGNRITIRENIETVEVDDANTNLTLERDETEEKI